MAPIYTDTDSSSDKKKNIKKPYSLCYPSMRETVTRNMRGLRERNWLKIKQQYNLLYSWGNFMVNALKDNDIKKQTDGNVLQRLKFISIIDKINLHNCQWNISKWIKIELNGRCATIVKIHVGFHFYQPQAQDRLSETGQVEKPSPVLMNFTCDMQILKGQNLTWIPGPNLSCVNSTGWWW